MLDEQRCVLYIVPEELGNQQLGQAVVVVFTADSGAILEEFELVVTEDDNDEASEYTEEEQSGASSNSNGDDDDVEAQKEGRYADADEADEASEYTEEEHNGAGSEGTTQESLSSQSQSLSSFDVEVTESTLGSTIESV
eukprot:NODE_488_length_2190_cov_41.343765_g448_i0.p3 GENE.NODE_488_length_2190_cov_41.343765_g448_i0~~NODE_488_length_2190_cov_41.343765_g448_i0.p3  ORF type:complete len:139 (+),score=47.09 NODE_488_length_2190_cov_41.343765_g448_i0:1235-1651(+)